MTSFFLRSVVHLELNAMPSLAITKSFVPVLISLGRGAFWRANVSRIGMIRSGLVVDFDKLEWKHVECCGSVTHSHTGTAHPFFSKIWPSSSTPD